MDEYYVLGAELAGALCPGLRRISATRRCGCGSSGHLRCDRADLLDGGEPRAGKTINYLTQSQLETMHPRAANFI
jgi:hypothetical protein